MAGAQQIRPRTSAVACLIIASYIPPRRLPIFAGRARAVTLAGKKRELGRRQVSGASKAALLLRAGAMIALAAALQVAPARAQTPDDIAAGMRLFRQKGNCQDAMAGRATAASSTARCPTAPTCVPRCSIAIR